MNLKDELRVRSKKAIQERADEEAKRVRRKREEVLGKAEELIRALPQKLKLAADSGSQKLAVMKPERGLHFDGTDTDLMENYRANGLRDLLKGGAQKVAAFLLKEGLTVSLEEEPHHDEGQGRAWTDILLVASW